MKDKIWDSFLDTEKTEQQQVELTSALTNRLLRYGIGNKKGYEQEIKILDALFGGLPGDAEIRKGFEALKLFIPNVASEILNRYDAIKYEINNASLDNLIIGACGLSPLGSALSVDNPDLNIYNTDLTDIINYRKSIEGNGNPKYSLEEWNLLDPDFHPDFVKKLSGKTGIVVEGLVLYLDEYQRKTLDYTLQSIAEQISPDKPVTFLFDYYISNISAKERDTKVMPDHPEWKYFKALVSNVHENQKAFFESREEVLNHLEVEGYNNGRVSQLSKEYNAHTILVCEK